MSFQSSAFDGPTISAIDTALPFTGPKPLPAEHIGIPSDSPLQQQPSPSNQTPIASSPLRPPSRVRTNSIGQFAIVSATSPSHKHSPSTLDARQQALEKLQEDSDSEASTTQDPDFLTSLASQERRVLEIREELEKAEQDLQQLKNQWVSHESSKRITEGSRLQQMQPLTSLSTNRLSEAQDDTDGSSAWMYEEMERRKALMNRGKRSSRRVFSGSRKPRPLSLVPQGAMNHFSTPNLLRFTETDDFDNDRAAQYRSIPDVLPPERGRRSPISFIRSPSTSPRRRSSYISGSSLISNDWRKGLWTFFEDLKHAAVGDEPRNFATNSTNSHRKQNSITSDKTKKSSSQSSTFEWAKELPKHVHNNHFRESYPRDHPESAIAASTPKAPKEQKPVPSRSTAQPEVGTPELRPRQQQPRNGSLVSEAVQKIESKNKIIPPTQLDGNGATPSNSLQQPDADSTPVPVSHARFSRDSNVLPETPIPSMETSDISYVAHFPEPPTMKSTPSRSKMIDSTSLRTTVIDGEAWETWDTPEPKQPLSAHSSNLSNSGNSSPSPQASASGSTATDSTGVTPRQSSEPFEQRHSIPWPALTKLGPPPLHRTASNLMDEWEKSLVEDAAIAAHWTFENPEVFETESSTSTYMGVA